jgi:predicted MFS family arabinose efflux permease
VAVVFFAVVPPLVARAGGPMLFLIMGGFMALAAVLAALAFPRVEVATAAAPQSTDRRPLGASVWFAMVGFGLMALNQSLMFSFLERIGFFRGFDQAQVLGLLVALGLVNLLPAPLAGLLQRRLRPERVMVAGPLLQLALALVITQSTVFLPYAVAACVYIGVLTFTHTFTFGFLAHSDPTGRAVAATPVMTMTGSAIGPVVGGMVVQNLGYPVIGIAAALVALVSFTCFVRSSQSAESAGLAIGRPEAT